MHFSRGRLRGHRHGQELTQAEVAHRVGITSDEYWLIETGEFTPDVALVDTLAKALGLPTTELSSEGTTWTQDYVNAALRYTPPLEHEDVVRAARAIVGERA